MLPFFPGHSQMQNRPLFGNDPEPGKLCNRAGNRAGARLETDGPNGTFQEDAGAVSLGAREGNTLLGAEAAPTGADLRISYGDECRPVP